MDTNDIDNIDFERVVGRLSLIEIPDSIRIPSKLRMESYNSNVNIKSMEYAHYLARQHLGDAVYKVLEKVRPIEYVEYFEKIENAVIVSLNKAIEDHEEIMDKYARPS